MATIETVTALLLAYRYLVIVPLSLVAQPLVGMLSGVLARLGYFDILIVYAVLVVTAVLGDIFWYWIGYRWGMQFMTRFGRFVSITPKHVEGVKKIFNRYHASILLISKITNGVGFALVTLFTAGLTRVPFGRFVVFNVIGESIWSAMILSIGYFLGNAYITVNNGLGKAFITALVILLIAVIFGVAKYMHSWVVSQMEQ
ncbi:MAG TPA: DedA family protein [Candidatus Paceibacterota bacterium]|nr:DedA family protein [Candidatus Paceibacterota bacterium]